jgi:ribosomal protein S18 acetylase RimI-like enzyme
MRATRVEIQPATLEDAAEILALQKRAYQSEAAIYGAYDIPPLTQTLAEMEGDLAQQTVLVARETGPAGPAIVGSVRAYEQDGICHIGRLIVHPAHQNQGLGTRLMREIEGAFAHTCERYALFTGHKSARNLHLYGKLGYKEFKREPVSEALTIVHLEKPRP